MCKILVKVMVLLTTAGSIIPSATSIPVSVGNYLA
jgi:hypothetical protein